jgi:hypothetical protein
VNSTQYVRQVQSTTASSCFFVIRPPSHSADLCLLLHRLPRAALPTRKQRLTHIFFASAIHVLHAKRPANGVLRRGFSSVLAGQILWCPSVAASRQPSSLVPPTATLIRSIKHQQTRPRPIAAPPWLRSLHDHTRSRVSPDHLTNESVQVSRRTTTTRNVTVAVCDAPSCCRPRERPRLRAQSTKCRRATKASRRHQTTCHDVAVAAATPPARGRWDGRRAHGRRIALQWRWQWQSP